MGLLVVTEYGERRLLDLALRETTPPDPTFTLALWVAPWTIKRTTLWDQLTEATFGGYARIDLDRATWTAAVSQTGEAYAQYADVPQSWVCSSSPQTVYGYAVLDLADEEIVWAQRFANPRTLTVGAQIDVLPVLTSESDSVDGT